MKDTMNFNIVKILHKTKNINSSYINEWMYKYEYSVIINNDVANGNINNNDTKETGSEQKNQYHAIINTTLDLREEITYFSKQFSKVNKNNKEIFYISQIEPIVQDVKFQLICELYKTIPNFPYNITKNIKDIITNKNIMYAQDKVNSEYISPLLDLIERYYEEIGFDFLLNLFHYYSFKYMVAKINGQYMPFAVIKDNLYPIKKIAQDPYFSAITNLYSHDILDTKVNNNYPLKSISLIHELFLQSVGRFRSSGKRYFWNERFSYLKFNEIYKYLSKYNAISKQDLTLILQIAIKFNILTLKEDKYYLTEIYQKELYIQNTIENIVKINESEDFRVTSTHIYAASKPMEHGHDQKKAITEITSTKSGINVLIGGPGTGKTTTLKTIVRLQKLIYDIKPEDILFLAPTKKAVGVMTEALGEPAYTVKDAILNKKINNKEFIVIDEFGVVSLFDFYDFLLQCNPNQKILLIGDDAQLQSIEFGTVLKDICTSSSIPISRLEEIFRQGKNSPIINLAYSIKNKDVKQTNLVSNNNSFQVENISNLQLFIQMLDLDLKFFSNLDYVQIICPTNKYSNIKEYKDNPNKFFSLSANNVNYSIQQYKIKKYNTQHKKINGRLFTIGDKVMQKVNLKSQLSEKNFNNKELPQIKGVFNGDTGIIKKINKDELFVKFENGAVFKYMLNNNTNGIPINNLEIAYAITTMKSQGSEWNTVIMLLDDNISTMPVISRNNLYVGVTRAKENLLIGYNFTKNNTILKYFQNSSKISSSDNTRSDLFLK